MKVYSIGLEINAEISYEELLRLKTEPLFGTLKFHENNLSETSHERSTREIPIEIRYSPRRRELIVPMQIPKSVYFGKAKRVRFFINPEFYNILLENKNFGQRFWKSGRLEIVVKEVKS